MLSKREKHLESQIAEQDAIARKNVSTNKNIAKAALKRKKANEKSLENIQGQITTLEQQIYTLESATLNFETLRVMKDAGQAMKTINDGLDIETVEETMEEIRERAMTSIEIGQVIASTTFGNEVDEDELLKELEDMEQEQLDKTMIGAPVVPVSQVGNGPEKGKTAAHVSKEEEDEEAELRKLQAEMMMG